MRACYSTNLMRVRLIRLFDIKDVMSMSIIYHWFLRHSLPRRYFITYCWVQISWYKILAFFQIFPDISFAHYSQISDIIWYKIFRWFLHYPQRRKFNRVHWLDHHRTVTHIKRLLQLHLNLIQFRPLRVRSSLIPYLKRKILIIKTRFYYWTLLNFNHSALLLRLTPKVPSKAICLWFYCPIK